MSAVPSVEPSSTTMVSAGVRRCDRTDSRHLTSHARRLRVGITTETVTPAPEPGNEKRGIVSEDAIVYGSSTGASGEQRYTASEENGAARSDCVPTTAWPLAYGSDAVAIHHSR